MELIAPGAHSNILYAHNRNGVVMLWTRWMKDQLKENIQMCTRDVVVLFTFCFLLTDLVTFSI